MFCVKKKEAGKGRKTHFGGSFFATSGFGSSMIGSSTSDNGGFCDSSIL
jgi:hypothetical protein